MRDYIINFVKNKTINKSHSLALFIGNVITQHADSISKRFVHKSKFFATQSAISCQHSLVFLKHSCLFTPLFFFFYYQQMLGRSIKKTNFEFHYIKRHNTLELVREYLHIMESDDRKQYIKQIGQFVYEFEIIFLGEGSTNDKQDQDNKWRVLKTKKEIQKYLRSEDNQYLYKSINYANIRIANVDDFFLLSQFQIINPNEKGDLFMPEPVIKFFELYNLNIKKRTSFLMEKKTRGLTRAKRAQNWCFGVEWNLRRIIITSEGVIQMANDGSVTDFLKFDLFFSVKSGQKATSQQLGIALVSAQRKIVLKARNAMQFLSFMYYITLQIREVHRNLSYTSSSPKSNKNNIEFYVDAQQYFTKVADGIESANKDVLMCGWWISPELYLKRPLQKENKEYWRLDNLLQRTARRGVKIYIVVFFAPSVIPNDSDYTKRALVKLDKNIIVQRHPHQILPKMWSHHQKVVIIDQKTAFMGGLDLCYGRFDTSTHPINDNNPEFYPGIDYNNVRIKDFIEVSKPDRDLQQRDLPRMPWHDVAFRVQGQMVSDVANHLIQYWNFTTLEKGIAPIVNKEAQDKKVKRQNLEQSKPTTALGLNAILKNVIDQSNKNDQQKIDYFLQQKSKRDNLKNLFRTEFLKKKIQINNGPGQNGLLLSMEGLGLLRQKQTRQTQKFKDEVQLLRSASEWSIGLEQGVVERSIQNAYLSAIYNAKHFIYIENQFFISATDQKDSFVENQIANALYERIERAHNKGETFRVIIFMPLLPGMEGSLDEKCPVSLKLTMHWQYKTISRGGHSLLERVAKLNNGRYKKYIEFFSLRSHGLLKGRPVTQLIYIHTKLMIVDDNIIICGSANINDRSQAGNRDSELAIIFTKGKKIQIEMNGEKIKVNQKAHQLRVKLYQEHFGLTKQIVKDPILLKNVQIMGGVAKENTLLFREIFGCSPDDTATTFEKVKQLEKVMNQKQTEIYYEKSKRILGHVVQFPTKFLQQQNLFKLGLDKIQDIFT